MTVAIAVRHSGEVAVAADSRTTAGNRKSVLATPKVEKRGHAIIAYSGACGHTDALRSQLFGVIAEHGDEWPMKWAEHCLDGKDDTAIRRLVDENDSYLLTVYKGRLFHVYADGAFAELDEDLLEIGCGGEIALGAAAAMLDRYKSARTIAEKAVEIACSYDNGCGPPIVCETMAAEGA